MVYGCSSASGKKTTIVERKQAVGKTCRSEVQPKVRSEGDQGEAKGHQKSGDGSDRWVEKMPINNRAYKGRTGEIEEKKCGDGE